MIEKQIFFLDEVEAFLRSIDPKASAKIIYNIQKVFILIFQITSYLKN